MINNRTYPIDITNGPGPALDFQPVPDADALAASAVALANTDGGAVVFGLDQDGAYTGPVDGAEVTRALRAASQLCNPAIPLDSYELVATPDGPAVAIRIGRGARVHALDDGRVFVRAGSKNRLLNGDEIRQFISARANGEFEAEVIPGARPRDLDPQWVSDFLVRYATRLGMPSQCDSDEMLLHMGAITPDTGVTVAGMLLFGLEPQHWLPQSAARFVRYLDRGGKQIAIDQTLDGPAVRLIDNLWALVREQMRTPATLSDSETLDGSLDYPREAVREALVNAVAHRDYRLREKHVTVSLYPDRLAIASPGGLPGFLTKDHILGGRYSRNPRLNWGLDLWGYAAQTGSGLFTILFEMDRYGHRPPEIVDGHYAVEVRLYKAGDPGTDDAIAAPDTATLNDRQHAALAYIREHGSITLREFRTLCATAHPTHLQRDLADLVGAGHLRKIGSRTRAYYILA